MASVLWQVSYDNTNWESMKSPSTYKITFEDLDSDSYRDVIAGELHRNRISNDWIKLQMSWNVVTESEAYTLRNKVKTNPTYYCRCKCPEITGAGDGWTTFVAYTSKFNSELLEGRVGREVSLDVIQAEKGSWMS